MRNKIFTFLQKNYGWTTAVLTGISIMISFILRFIKYIYSTLYFNYYGLSYEFFNSNELGFLYSFGFSILFLLCCCSVMYCYVQLFNMNKKKLKLKTILFNVFIILILNMFVIYSPDVKYSIWQFVLNIVFVIIIEIIATFIFVKAIRKEYKKDDSYDLCDNLKVLPFYLILLIFMLGGSYGSQIMMNKSYRIINDNKVILYSTNDYYLILDCEIKDNKLTIYKGNQTKINNENIKSQLITFDEVKIK